MNKLLFCFCFVLTGWTTAVEEVSIKELMERVEYLEKRLKVIETDPLAAYFPDSSQNGDTIITKRSIGYTHSYNDYANTTLVFCGSSSRQKRSSFGHAYNSKSYNEYHNENGSFIICDGGHYSSKASGVSYIVWGKQYCPNGQTLYSGVLGGNYVKHSAGSSDQVCLPDTPQYSTHASGSQQRGRVYPGKYDTQSYKHLKKFHGTLVRCAACYNDASSTVMMIPAVVKCPNQWKEEYQGYLMTQPDVAGYFR